MPSDRLAQRKDGTSDPVVAQARQLAQALLKAKADCDVTREYRLFQELLSAERAVVTKQGIEFVPDNSIRLETLKLLMSYGYGKPAQLVEHTGKDGGDIQVFHNVPRPQKQIGSAITVEVIDAVRE